MAEQKKTKVGSPSGKGVNRQAKKSTGSASKKDDQWRAEQATETIAYRDVTDQGEAAWLESLKHESMQFLENRAGGSLEQIKQESIDKEAIEITVDSLFSCLQGFMYEFNKVAAGTDLHVSGTISGDVTEVISYNKYREAEETRTYFRARLSTRIYSLLIRGKDKTIDFFLLPVNRAMALSTMEDEIKPLATIELMVDEGGIAWKPIADGSGFNSLKDLCAWLFKQLIERTREAISGDNYEKKEL